MKEPKIVVILLAGGRGERLLPLTGHRAKPAVPFGGKWRIVDFVLSNCLHSGLSDILISTQYKSASLWDHLDLGWGDIFVRERGERLSSIQPQQRTTKELKPYEGTADAVYENIYSLSRARPSFVLILASDHIYRMDYRELIRFHQEKKAELTIAAVEVDRELAKGNLGVLTRNSKGRAVGFEEKPENPEALSGNPGKCLASMGIYIFSSKALVEELTKDTENTESEHDFGKNIIPQMIRAKKRVFVFPFQDYWRDIGTIEAYYLASMDLVSISPEFNLHDQNWPWLTSRRNLPPAKTVFGLKTASSIISEGCLIDEAEIYHSILCSSIKIGRNVRISDSIIFPEVQIGDNVEIAKAIIDKENIIPDGSIIRADNMKYDGKFEKRSSGITIVPRHHDFSSWP